MMLFAGDNAADAQEHRGDGMWDTQDVWEHGGMTPQMKRRMLWSTINGYYRII
jgi:hypothetical protein